MYSDEFDALRAEKIMNPFRNPGIRLYPAAAAAITKTALDRDISTEVPLMPYISGREVPTHLTFRNSPIASMKYMITTK